MLRHQLPALASRLYLKVARNVRRRGVLGCLLALSRRHRQEPGACIQQFDHEFGTDTGGFHRVRDLPSGYQEPAGGVLYQATPPRLFHEMISKLPIDPTQFTFLDIGSGKGMALLLASQHRFRRVIGIELSRELHSVAAGNIDNFRGPERICQDVRSLCQNALTYELPAEPLVIYLFNPFDRSLLEKILQRIAGSLESDPRPTYVVYCNPVEARVFRGYPRFRKHTSNAEYAIFHFSGKRKSLTCVEQCVQGLFVLAGQVASTPELAELAGAWH